MTTTTSSRSLVQWAAVTVVTALLVGADLGVAQPRSHQIDGRSRQHGETHRARAQLPTPKRRSRRLKKESKCKKSSSDACSVEEEIRSSTLPEASSDIEDVEASERGKKEKQSMKSGKEKEGKSSKREKGDKGGKSKKGETSSAVELVGDEDLADKPTPTIEIVGDEELVDEGIGPSGEEDVIEEAEPFTGENSPDIEAADEEDLIDEANPYGEEDLIEESFGVDETSLAEVDEDSDEEKDESNDAAEDYSDEENENEDETNDSQDEAAVESTILDIGDEDDEATTLSSSINSQSTPETLPSTSTSSSQSQSKKSKRSGKEKKSKKSDDDEKEEEEEEEESISLSTNESLPTTSSSAASTSKSSKSDDKGKKGKGKKEKSDDDDENDDEDANVAEFSLSDEDEDDDEEEEIESDTGSDASSKSQKNKGPKGAGAKKDMGMGMGMGMKSMDTMKGMMDSDGEFLSDEIETVTSGEGKDDKKGMMGMSMGMGMGMGMGMKCKSQNDNSCSTAPTVPAFKPSRTPAPVRQPTRLPKDEIAITTPPPTPPPTPSPRPRAVPQRVESNSPTVSPSAAPVVLATVVEEGINLRGVCDTDIPADATPVEFQLVEFEYTMRTIPAAQVEEKMSEIRSELLQPLTDEFLVCSFNRDTFQVAAIYTDTEHVLQSEDVCDNLEERCYTIHGSFVMDTFVRTDQRRLQIFAEITNTDLIQEVGEILEGLFQGRKLYADDAEILGTKFAGFLNAFGQADAGFVEEDDFGSGLGAAAISDTEPVGESKSFAGPAVAVALSFMVMGSVAAIAVMRTRRKTIDDDFEHVELDGEDISLFDDVVPKEESLDSAGFEVEVVTKEKGWDTEVSSIPKVHVVNEMILESKYMHDDDDLPVVTDPLNNSFSGVNSKAPTFVPAELKLSLKDLSPRRRPSLDPSSRDYIAEDTVDL